MNKDYTISETFTLPSHGLVYDVQFDPHITLRSMTTAEEMKRLSYSDTPYKLMSEIIEDCIIEDLPIHVYDMCLGDYQFLLHKIRIVTYGPDYKMKLTCPVCGETNDTTINLEDLEVKEIDKDFREEMFIELPVSKHKIRLRLQTPRDLDTIKLMKEEKKKKTKEIAIDYGLLYTITSFIDTVNGSKLNPIEAEQFALKLPMRDVNYIISKGDEFSRKVGLDNNTIAKCGSCGCDIPTFFRITSEFFGPTN